MRVHGRVLMAALVPALASQVACSDGRVNSDVLSFGASSGVWFELMLSTEVGDVHWHQLVLSSQSGLCRKAQSAFPEAGAAADRRLADVMDNLDDVDAQCAAEQVYYDELTQLMDGFFGNKGTQSLVMTVRDSEADQDQPPPAGTIVAFGSPDANGDYAIVGLGERFANPYAIYASGVDCGDPAWVQAAEDDVDADTDTWFVTSGALEVKAKGDSRYKVELEGNLFDETAQPAGEVSARGTFAHCPVSWTGDFPIYL